MTDSKKENSNIGGKAGRGGPASRHGMTRGFALAAGVFLLGAALQHLLARTGVLEGWAVGARGAAVGLVAFALSAGAGAISSWRRFLISIRFAVPAIFTLTALSVAGTLVLQREPEAVMRETYGPAFGFIRFFFLEDIFHSFGFCALLGLAAGSLALTVVRKRRITRRYLGVLGAHLGLLLVLAGAAVGNLGLVKGRLNLHKGKQSDSIVLKGEDGKPEKRSLGFTVRLDDFKLLHYDPEFVLAVYGREGTERKRLLAVSPAAGQDEELAGRGVEILDYWPDHERQTVVTPLPGAPPDGTPAVAALGLEEAGKRDAGPAWVFDRGGASGGRLELGNPSLAFFWQRARAERFLETQSAARASSPHAVVVAGQKLPVEIGKSYPIAGSDHRIEILRGFNDFFMDTTSGKPANRSDRPDNPALEIAVTDSDGKSIARTWLFSNFPSFHGQSARSTLSGLRYIYDQGRAKRRVDAVAVGEASELWSVANGVVGSRQKLDAGETVELGGKGYRVKALHRSARTSIAHATRSNTANNPVVKVEIRGMNQPQYLRPGRPLRLDDRTVLVLEPKGDNVRDYLSTVSILEQGRKVLTRTVEVNHPLEYKGYAIYQADYRPDDPTFSGFQVVRDPGLWIVYLGFVLNVLGVLAALYLPRAGTRAAAGGGQGEEK